MKRLLSIIIVFVGVAGCVSKPFNTSEESRNKAERKITVLHVNDVYRIDGINEGSRGSLARVRTLRRELAAADPNTLFLHGGDFLFPSIESEVFEGQQMIDVLNLMDGETDQFDDKMMVVFGNHEFDKAGQTEVGILERAVANSQFTWLTANIDFTGSKSLTAAVTANKLINIGGMKVGVFGISIDSKVPDYASIDNDYRGFAEQQSRLLRDQGAELVIALTHLELADDREILSLGIDGPDVIFGGHEHEQMIVEVDGRYIVKADADAISASVSQISLTADGSLKVAPTIVALGAEVSADELVSTRIDKWKEKLSKKVCSLEDQGASCVDTVLGTAEVVLIGEEKSLRRYETNLGNWVTDAALQHFKTQGAQIVFLNSGGLRLNQNILAGANITIRHLDELLPYDNGLVLIEISGAELQKVVNHSVEGWTGNGWWLQVAGFAFEHDSKNGKAQKLSIITDKGPRLVQAEEKILAVTSAYLVNQETDQDGYSFLTQEHLRSNPNIKIKLKDVLLTTLKNQPNVRAFTEGRICNESYSPTCLLTEN